MTKTAGAIKGVVFDLAGTVMDYGSRAPLLAFRRLFQEECRHTVSDDVIRAPMGSNKRDHIQAIVKAMRWKQWDNDTQIDHLYAKFKQIQIEEIRRRAKWIPGALPAIYQLREGMGIQVCFTTGYNREMTNALWQEAYTYGVPHWAKIVTSDDVARGRPYPDMLAACAQHMGIENPRAIMKVGDTAVDMEEGKNAGTYTVGVSVTGNEVGLDEHEWKTLVAKDASEMKKRAETVLYKAGADVVVDNVGHIPRLIYEMRGK